MDCVIRYGNNVHNLETKIEVLSNAKDGLQHSVDMAKGNRENIEADVQQWLSSVPRITEEAKNWLQQAQSKAYTRCLCLSFPNLLSLRKLSGEAKDMVQKVISEIQKADRFEKISYRRPIVQSLIENKGYEAFESRSLILREIMEALRDRNILVIGLHGMAGTGKTMMAKEIARQTMEEKLFSELVMLTVSQTRDDRSLQQRAAKQLELEFEGSDFSVRADELRRRLRQEKKVLIIVDDVWQSFDLDDAGISFRDHQKQCKMLLISRRRGVLCNMGVEKNVHVGTLSEGESVDLFKKIVGSNNINNAAVEETELQQSLAIDIVKKCACLPLAITEVASALAERSYPDALQELNTSITTPHNIVGMHKKVFDSIQLSYNFLQSERREVIVVAFEFISRRCKHMY